MICFQISLKGQDSVSWPDLWSDGSNCKHNSRVDSCTFCKPYCAFMDDFSFGSSGLPSLESDRPLRIRVESNRIESTLVVNKTPCAFSTSLRVLANRLLLS